MNRSTANGNGWSTMAMRCRHRAPPKEMIETKVASCKGRAPALLTGPAEGANENGFFARPIAELHMGRATPMAAARSGQIVERANAPTTVILDQVAAPA